MGFDEEVIFLLFRDIQVWSSIRSDYLQDFLLQVFWKFKFSSKKLLTICNTIHLSWALSKSWE